MSLRSISAAIVVAGVLFAGCLQADERVEYPLALALKQSDSARVTILFNSDTATALSRQSREQRQATIGRISDRVESVAGEGFAVHRRFSMVAAIVGTVDQEALDRILSLPEVSAVGLDPGGSGHLDIARVVMGIDTVQAQPPIGLGLTGENIKVVVMDSGIDSDNIDFNGALIDEVCFCTLNTDGSDTPCCPNGLATQTGPGAAEDDHGHGTWVSGHVLSRGNDGPRGAAPDASLVAVKVLNRDNSFCCASDVTAAYDWIATNHPDADVVNSSLGTFALFDSECSASTSWLIAMAQATAAVEANGTLMTASTGNDQSTTGIAAPSCLDDVIGVGATFKEDLKGTFNCAQPQVNPRLDDVACFSNVAPILEVLAPGALMDSPNLGGGTIQGISGTSFAAPLVAGCAALIKAARPNDTADEIRATLANTGVSVLDNRVDISFPRVDCLSAILSVPLFNDGFES